MLRFLYGGVEMKKIYCNQCGFAKYVKNKGYYCESPCFDEKKLIMECPRYQLGMKSPRWCPRKGEK